MLIYSYNCTSINSGIENTFLSCERQVRNKSLITSELTQNINCVVQQHVIHYNIIIVYLGATERTKIYQRSHNKSVHTHINYGLIFNSPHNTFTIINTTNSKTEMPAKRLPFSFTRCPSESSRTEHWQAARPPPLLHVQATERA